MLQELVVLNQTPVHEGRVITLGAALTCQCLWENKSCFTREQDAGLGVYTKKLHVHVSVVYIISVVCIVTRSRIGRSRDRGSIPSATRDFPLLQNFRSDYIYGQYSLLSNGSGRLFLLYGKAAGA